MSLLESQDMFRKWYLYTAFDATLKIRFVI